MIQRIQKAGRMRSPQSKRGRGDPDEVDHTVQDTLDAFREMDPAKANHSPVDEDEGHVYAERVEGGSNASRQASIDAFLVAGWVPPPPVRGDTSTRAMEGIALEMSMEWIALTEAASGIMRDELLVTIAREIQLPLQRLDLVDGYITDLELEGKLRRVGDVVVLAHPDDEDLMTMDTDEEEFLRLYRRRYSLSRRGDDR